MILGRPLFCRHGFAVCGTCSAERARLGWIAEAGDEDVALDERREIADRLAESEDIARSRRQAGERA